VIKNSNQRAAALKLIEWLSTSEAQAIFASVNLEMPVNPSAKVDPLIQSWGAYRVDPNNISLAGKHQSQAVRLMDRAGWK
jgi:iron(III) transport system substrate-binding protein